MSFEVDRRETESVGNGVVVRAFYMDSQSLVSRLA